LDGCHLSLIIATDGILVNRRNRCQYACSFNRVSDHLKTASVITDSAGTIKAESDYYPWGGELRFLNNDSNHYKFTGKERDAETGLDYFGARYYSNTLGRWLTPDWAAKPAAIPYAVLGDPQTFNLYSYVPICPLRRSMPMGTTGLCWPRFGDSFLLTLGFPRQCGR
jgi:RHS repeat-associated protein